MFKNSLSTGFLLPLAPLLLHTVNKKRASYALANDGVHMYRNLTGHLVKLKDTGCENEEIDSPLTGSVDHCRVWGFLEQCMK